MKVLYLGAFRDGSGYSRAALDYARCMSLAGIDVVCRPVRYNNHTEEMPGWYLELESKSDKDCDVCIQHFLPDRFVYNGNFNRNILMYAVENDSIPASWVESSNLADEVWTFCEASKRAIVTSGVEVPVHVVPHAIDLSKFQRSYPKLDIRKKYPNDVIYYTIGEFQERKNIAAIVRAFHTALDPDDAAQLILKVNIPGKSPQETLKVVGDFCNEVKHKLRLYPNQNDYKPVHIVSDRLSDEHMMVLHNTCDVYINASRGEGWGLPVTDAMGMGKCIISPRHTAMKDYLDYTNARLVDFTKDRCYGHMETLPNLSTSRESWYNVNVDGLSDAIRSAYLGARSKEYPTNQVFGANAMRTIFEDYGYDKVGNIIKDLLNGTE